MTHDEFSKNVWDYIWPMAYPEDMGKIRDEIDHLFHCGWTWLECARYINCFEEVAGSGPDARISEEKALIRMAEIIRDVQKRQGRQNVEDALFEFERRTKDCR